MSFLTNFLYNSGGYIFRFSNLGSHGLFYLPLTQHQGVRCTVTMSSEFGYRPGPRSGMRTVVCTEADPAPGTRLDKRKCRQMGCSVAYRPSHPDASTCQRTPSPLPALPTLPFPLPSPVWAPGLCLVFGPRDGGYEGKKKFVYLKWASHVWHSIQKFSFPQRKLLVLGGGVVGEGPLDHPPHPLPA